MPEGLDPLVGALVREGHRLVVLVLSVGAAWRPRPEWVLVPIELVYQHAGLERRRAFERPAESAVEPRDAA